MRLVQKCSQYLGRVYGLVLRFFPGDKQRKGQLPLCTTSYVGVNIITAHV
jgi:hypothetical protein